MASNIHHLVFLVSIFLSALFGMGLALQILTKPHPFHSVVDNQLNISCVEDGPTHLTKTIMAFQIRKQENSKPIAVINSVQGLVVGTSFRDNMKTDGRIDTNTGHGYLNLTIEKPSLVDAGTYSCQMYFYDTNFTWYEAMEVANVTFDGQDITDTVTDLMGKVSNVTDTAKQRKDGDSNKEDKTHETERQMHAQQIDSLKNYTKKQEQQIKALENDIDIQEGEIADLKNDNIEQERQIKALQNDYIEQEQNIDVLENDNYNHKQQIEALKKHTIEQEQHIETLENDYNEQKQQIDALRDDNNGQEELEAIKNYKNEKERQIEELKNDNAEQERQLDILKDIMENQNDKNRQFEVKLRLLKQNMDTPVCPIGWTYYKADERCLQVFGLHDDTKYLNWSMSKDMCKNLGGYLVQIRDEQKNNFVSDVIEETRDVDTLVGVWIGIRSHRSEFKYLDCSIVDAYHPWGEGQPEDEDDGSNKTCVYLRVGRPYHKQWWDIDCSTPAPYACSIPVQSYGTEASSRKRLFSAPYAKKPTNPARVKTASFMNAKHSKRVHTSPNAP